ncbi:MAG: recombinase family protein [Fusobacterium mortiferum]|nr:recombinase family protein [Fusobacterium mortiferum]
MKVKNRKLGYVRVSTNEQSEARQIEILKQAGVFEENIYIEKASGKNFIGRTEWTKLLAACVVEDTIVITELDRLGRNKVEIKETFELIQKKGVNLEILNMPLLNTGISNPLIADLIRPIVLELLGYIAEEERKTILKRQREGYNSLEKDSKGRFISRKTGKPVGRKNAYENLTREQEKYIKLWIEKRITTEECIKFTNLSRSTIFRIKKIILNKEKVE